MTPPEDDGARECEHEVRDLVARVVLLEAQRGRIEMGPAAWAVVVSVLGLMFAAVGFMARVDARQEEQGALLRQTVGELHAHIQSDNSGSQDARLDALQRDVGRLQGMKTP